MDDLQPTRLMLVRHGDAFAGFDGIVDGPLACRGLTSLGRDQAALLRDRIAASPRLRADALVVSELPRAIETAQILAPAHGIDDAGRDCDLCEFHTGEAAGLEWSDYTARYGASDLAEEPDRVFAPGGDSWNTFNSRVLSVMTRLATSHPGETVMAVCHAGVISASMRMLLDMPARSTIRLVPTNTGITEWEYEPTEPRWTLRYYNDAGHLYDGPR